MTSEFVRRRVCDCRLVILFHVEFFIPLIFHVPNFYPSDYLFVTTTLMDFMQRPYLFYFQFHKSTKAKFNSSLKICHGIIFLLFFTNSYIHRDAVTNYKQ
jgi:hypothetical protein